MVMVMVMVIDSALVRTLLAASQSLTVSAPCLARAQPCLVDGREDMGQDPKGRTGKGPSHVPSASMHHERTGWREAQERQLVTRLRCVMSVTMRFFRADKTKFVDRCAPALDCPEAAVAHGEAAGEHGSSDHVGGTVSVGSGRGLPSGRWELG